MSRPLPWLLLCLCLCLANTEFVALDPLDYQAHFVEGWPGPFANGSGVGDLNASTFNWSVDNLPLFDSSDKDLVAAYYYRAKSYKSHVIQTDWVDIKHVVSEFGPSVPWGGVYGTINAAAGHHIREGRWIRDPSYMDGLIRFWIGSQNQPVISEAGVGHFANGTTGQSGSCPYTSWILTAAVQRAMVKGDLSLGTSWNTSNGVGLSDFLPDMVAWWEERTMQLRVDCIEDNGGVAGGQNRTCLDLPPSSMSKDSSAVEMTRPYCYIINDNWDAMEGSVSGRGCRPTIGAMMWSEALAIATVANMTGGVELTAKFERRAGWIREWYLKHLWNDEAKWLTVYKEGREFTGEGGCTQQTLNNQSDASCCCVPPGATTGAYANFSACPFSSDPTSASTSASASTSTSTFTSLPPPPPRDPGNKTLCDLISPSADGRSSSYQCGRSVPVRELLGLGPAYYFGIAPKVAPKVAAKVRALGGGSGGSKFDSMWSALFDAEEGFWAEFGPTTVERRATCFNKSQDTQMCNWAGPSWPYETSRVLTGLSNFLSDYPPTQAKAAGITPAHYNKLLRTYARSMTRGVAVNGSKPWVGENIEPDKGFWIARDILYKGGSVDDHGVPNAPVVNCSACDGLCYDRSWASDGHKCDSMPPSTWATMGACNKSCHCVPPASSFPTPDCCNATPSCDGKIIPKMGKDRGKDYNHSTFLDLIIEGLIGLRALFGRLLIINPLVDPSSPDLTHFALDNVHYHGHNISVFYDPQGSVYARANCTGLCVFVDGVMVVKSPTITSITTLLPSNNGL